MSLEKFLKGEPLSEHIAAIRNGTEDEPSPVELEIVQKIVREFSGNYAPNDDDREHLRRLLTEPGWAVLLKLLDNEIVKLEDAAKRRSLEDPLSEGLNQLWAAAAYSKKARSRIFEIADYEIRKLQRPKKKPESE